MVLFCRFLSIINKRTYIILCKLLPTCLDKGQIQGEVKTREVLWITRTIENDDEPETRRITNIWSNNEYSTMNNYKISYFMCTKQ